MRSILASLGLSLSVVALAPPSAEAADVLFVSDANTDVNIADALRADGHTVIVVINDFISFESSNPTLTDNLTPYDCVIWSASGTGFGAMHAAETFTALEAYVGDGGRVLVTGLGSVGWVDTNLVRFLGGTGGISFSGNPGTIAAVDNSLTTGSVDLRGIVPRAWEFRYEGVTGPFTDTTVVMMGTGGFGTPAAQWTIRGLGSGEIAFIANGSGTTTPPSWVSTSPGGDGAYNAAIRNFVAASGGSASEPGAPEVRFDAPFTTPEGAAIEITVEVVDPEGDTFDVSWDLDGDGTYGENEGELAYTIPAGTTDGEGALEIGVEAVDAGGHRTERTRRMRVQNVAPTIVSSPPLVASIAENLVYTFVTEDPAGDQDTLTYELVRGPTSASVGGGAFRFVPGEGDVTAEGETIGVEVAVLDEDGGRSTQMWEMEVANNYAPSDLVQEYPIEDVVLIDRLPRLVVRDGSDVEGDSMQYFFELDTVETFDSPALVQSGAIDQEPGFTSFQLTEELADGHYFWRAWLTDGTAVTQPHVSSFHVISVMGEVDDAGVGDAAPMIDGGTTPPGDRGCACAAQGASSGNGALAGLFLLGLVLAGRRGVKVSSTRS